MRAGAVLSLTIGMSIFAIDFFQLEETAAVWNRGTRAEHLALNLAGAVGFVLRIQLPILDARDADRRVGPGDTDAAQVTGHGNREHLLRYEVLLERVEADEPQDRRGVIEPSGPKML